jgi:hypothetical protein
MDALADLRQQLNKRVPGGLTTEADARLQRTLKHFTSEVTRVRGVAAPQEILRLSYESMVKWLRQATFTSEVDPETLFASIKPSPLGQPDLSPLETRPLRSTPLIEISEVDNPLLSKQGEPSLFYKQSDNALLSKQGEPMVTQQSDVLQPHEDTIKYREVEYNLAVNSKDRNWLADQASPEAKNRYNFTLQFNTNFKNAGFGIQPTIQNRLRNIVRLEFIKAVLPVESLDVTLIKDVSNNSPATFGFSSVLGLPSVNVLVDEVEGNTYGTRNTIDRSLAVCQYDSAWRSDYHTDNLINGSPLSRGYSLFFPKFMKAQRVYTPAPLSNLQTLTFRLQDPEDSLLSTLPDSSPLTRIANGVNITGSIYADATSTYFFLMTSTFFPATSFSVLDKILVEGLSINLTNGPELVSWLQNSNGHSVVGIGYTSNYATVTDGPNAAGYANVIIIQNNMSDPTLGLTLPDPYIVANLNTFPINGAGVLNLSRQVQLFLRVITREYDLITNVRSDNV